MKRVRFTGRGRLLVYGYELLTGDSGVMADEQAAALVAHPRITVAVTDWRTDVKPEAERGEGQPAKNDEKE